MRNVPSLETVYRDYSPKGVKFFYVYKALAHPETNGYITPFNLSERLAHVKEAERRLGSGITWLCDTMSNDTKHALGNAPNSEFVIDPQGIVIRRRAWSHPAQLRRDLEELIGTVDQVTELADLHLQFIPPPQAAAAGVVPRLRLEGRFEPLQIVPVESQQPFYAKLRAEADGSLLRSGTGKLYLGFLLDPLYAVHWNNLALPLKFKITVPHGVGVAPASDSAPKIETPADIDPREFVVNVADAAPGETSLRVKVEYFACNDEEGWCKPVSQEYTVQLQTDPDGGWVQSRRAGAKAAKRKKAAR